MKRPPIIVWLHNIRSAHNVGSIFRTCDAAGVASIILSGYTPTPRDRFGRVQKEIAKTALGAEASMEWRYCRSASQALTYIHTEGHVLVGVEQDGRSINYKKYKPRTSTVFLFGEEVRGIKKKLRDACEAILEIPMHGKKESLNVSVAAGVVLFGIH